MLAGNSSISLAGSEEQIIFYQQSPKLLKIVSENFIHALLLFLGLFLKISRWVPLIVGEVDVIDLIQCRLNDRDLHGAGESKAIEGLRFPSLVHFFFPCFHPSFYQPFLLIPHVFFSFSLCVLMFSLDFPVKYFPLLSYPVSPEQISLTLSSHVQLSISEGSQPILMTPYHFRTRPAIVTPSRGLEQATSYRCLVFRPCNLYFWAKLWGEKIMNSW